METQVIEYKSLQKIKTGDKGFKELAKTCVCLANAQGGKILIGFDDKRYGFKNLSKVHFGRKKKK